MAELRRDTLTNSWAIIARERARRPNAFVHFARKVDDQESCAFCPGHEHMTPQTLITYPPLDIEVNSPECDWSVRVVSNRYPALRIEGDLHKRPEGLYDKMNGIGAHEVIVETPHHQNEVSEFSLPQLVNVFKAYQARMLDLYQDTRFQYITIFKNSGQQAGATISHAHSQLIALPIVPVRMEHKLKGANRYYEFRERNYFMDLMIQERQEGQRIVVHNEDFMVLAPFASRFSFEMQIVPRKHSPSFQDLRSSQMLSLAEVYRDVIRRYKLALRNPSFSCMIHSMPPGYPYPERFQWHIEMMPRLTEVGGFEWGTEFYVNPTSPEEAAAYLRELDQKMDIPSGYLLSPAEGS